MQPQLPWASLPRWQVLVVLGCRSDPPGLSSSVVSLPLRSAGPGDTELLVRVFYGKGCQSPQSPEPVPHIP